MKLKKLFAIMLAVALVLTMTVSVSAKRLDINDQIVIGTLGWSGTPNVYETLTATTKMRIVSPLYGLEATLSGTFRLANGTMLFTGYKSTDILYGENPPEAVISYSVQNGCWLRGDAIYDAYYGTQHTTASETKMWDV